MRLALTIGCIMMAMAVQSQVRNHPMSMLYRLEGERLALVADSGAVTSFYPMNSARVSLDSAFYYTRTRKYYFAYQEKILRDPLFYVKGEDFKIGIDPVFDFRFGKDFADTTAYADSVKLVGNTRGMRIEVDLGKNVSIQTSFYENQVHLPVYLRDYANETGVVPGMGRHKKFKDAGFDYANSFGWINWQVRPWLRLEAGQGKHFIGNGYRSLLLSDAASAYPYLKAVVESPNRKWTYHTMGVKLQSLDRQPLGEVPESLFKVKNATFHYLTYKPARWLEVGLFEGVIWKRWDDDKGTLPASWAMYVPLPGLGSSGMEGNNKGTMVQGLNLNGGSKQLRGYVQLGFEGNSLNKTQLGFKLFDFPVAGLMVQVENNLSNGKEVFVGANAQDGYTHQNEYLAFGGGPRTNEWMGLAHYHRKRVLIMAKFNYIERIDFSVARIYEGSLGYLINPNSGLSFRMGITNRNMTSGAQQSLTNFVYWSFSTLLWQSYSDF